MPTVGQRYVRLDVILGAILAAPGNIGPDFRERLANHVIEAVNRWEDTTDELESRDR